jgi:hypothetical protein
MFNMFTSAHEPCLRVVDPSGATTRRGRPRANKEAETMFDNVWSIKIIQGNYEPIQYSKIASFAAANIQRAHHALTKKERPKRDLIEAAVRAHICSTALRQSASILVTEAGMEAWPLFMAGGGDSDAVDATMLKENAPRWLAEELRAWALGREGHASVVPFRTISIQTTRLVSNRDGITVYAKRSGVVCNLANKFAAIVFNHKRLARISMEKDIPWVSSVVWPIKSLHLCPETNVVRMKCTSPAPSYICTLDFESSVTHGVAFASAICKSVAAIHVCEIAHGCLRGGFFFTQIHNNPPKVAEDISVALCPIFDRIRFRPEVELDAPERIMEDPFMRDIMDLICICTRLIYGSDLRSVATREDMRRSMQACREAGITRMDELSRRAWARINYYMDRLCDSVFTKEHKFCLIDLMSLCVECRKHIPFLSSKDVLQVGLSSSIERATPGFFASRPSNMLRRGAEHPWVAAAAASVSVPIYKLTKHQRALDHRSVVRAMQKMEAVPSRTLQLMKGIQVEEKPPPAQTPLQMIPAPLMKPLYPTAAVAAAAAAAARPSV